MKIYKRTMLLVLITALIFSLLGTCGAFAVDGAQPLKAPASVGGLKAYSSYNSVVLKWNPVTKDIDGNSYAAGVTVKYLVNGKDVSTKTVGNQIQYKTKKDLTPGKNYSFKVQAYVVDSGNKLVSADKSIVKAPARRIGYIVKVKRSGTLTSKRGKKAKYKVKAGQTIKTDRFATGRYIFDHNGSSFYISRSRLGKKTAEYTKKFNYSREEAQFFVNDRKISSKTKNLIWVSTYTQHVYLFSGKKGNWSCIDDWECATGTASTPSPTSISGLKVIGRKIRSKNSLPYWSAFHGEASFHGKRSGWDVGKPASNGCIRNANENAKKIYKNVKKGTRVIFY